eukprot:CAMPEP_0170101272 /NCGR_PEP_ID=MMETSP0020_2-20130122/2160_1 /TAXON_ID=98059 /ORGANISM="Dinobryon sp., Strain UTEXLB2267" /LENGTH=1091 /DNA_ID=CAMNT_0010324337 /DNA_START=453 /DNA_END=3728 /DNA_ORIENTATION=-
MTLQRCALASASHDNRELTEITVCSFCDIISLLMTSVQNVQPTAAICAYLLIHLSSQVSHVLQSINYQIGFGIYKVADHGISPSEKKSRGSNSGRDVSEKFIKTLIEVLIQVLSLSPSDGYLLNNSYLTRRMQDFELCFCQKVLTIPNIAKSALNKPIIEFMNNNTSSFNWIVALSLLAKPTTTEKSCMSQTEKAIFLANCCEGQSILSQLVGSFQPTAQLVSMLFDVLTRNEQEVLPLLLGLHFMDEGGCLNVRTSSNISTGIQDSSVAEELTNRNTTDMLTLGHSQWGDLELPGTFAEELNQMNQHLTGVKRLECRVFAIQLQICGLEWELGRHGANQYTDNIYSSLPDIVSIQTLASITTEKNFLLTLFDTFTELSVVTKADENQMDVTITADSCPQSNLLLQMKILSIFATVMISFPAITLTKKNSFETGSASKITVLQRSSYELLNILSFSRPNQPLVGTIWRLLTECPQIRCVLDFVIIAPGDEKILLKNNKVIMAARDLSLSVESLVGNVYSMLMLMCSVLSHHLTAVDDKELLEAQSLLPLSDITLLMQYLKQLLYKMYWTEPIVDSNSNILDSLQSPRGSEGAKTAMLLQSSLMKLQLLLVATKVFNQLCVRNERRQFLQVDAWQWPPLVASDLALRESAGSSGEEMTSEDDSAVDGAFVMKNSKIRAVLTYIPQVIPFKQRLSIFQSLLELDKAAVYGGDGSHGAIAAALGFGTSAVRIEVRRDRIVDDAFDALHDMPAVRLKGKVQVEFISGQGYHEAGIDGGGLFKEFLDAFSKSAFDPNFGLFVPTSTQLLTPKPSVHLELDYFNFIGKMMGKALYERVLLESEFAGGFLNLLLGRTNSFDDLYYLDEQMYRSLVNLRQFASSGGDIKSLELFFESSRKSDDQVVDKELIPGGSAIRVDNSNVHSYIHLLSHYKQNLETAEQCHAFVSGFRSIIPLEWIRMFSTRELQLLISGDRRPIDIADMQRHVHYASGYHESQPYIQAFWRIVSEMSPEDQGNLLRFVTSCSRQPLMGFGQLNPTFCIQQTPMYSSGVEMVESPRLPSAATCMNLLKLPKYDSEEMLKEKLLYAIRSNSGFELS